MGSAKKSRDVLFKWVVAVAVIVAFVLVAFAVGLLVGYGVFKESGEESSGASSSQQNWGSVAIVDGRTVDVLEWIDSALNATADRCTYFFRQKFATAHHVNAECDENSRINLLYNIHLNGVGYLVQTKSPNADFETVFDQWKHYLPDPPRNRPLVPGLGSGSDFTSFLQSYGISCTDMSYVYSEDASIVYPVYHSVHDNIYYETVLIDPDFAYHLTVGKVWGKVAFLLATSPVPPFDPRDYSIALSDNLSGLKNQSETHLSAQGISLEYLENTIKEFNASSIKLWEELQRVSDDPSDLNRLRMVNDQLMQLERSFIVPQGLPGAPRLRHVVYAPSSVNRYGSTSFPGVADAIYLALEFGGSWEVVREQLDLVRVYTLYASQIMAQQYRQ